MRRTLRIIGLGLLLHAVFCVALAHAVPSLQIRVGLDDRVVANRFAPISVTVSGLSFPVSGVLSIHQQVGNAWRGQASATIELASGTITNGTYRSVIPVYEPVNPFSVDLLDDEGAMILADDVVLRDAQETAPFPLAVGRALPAGAPTAWIDASELPTDWTAFDAVSVLWIGGAPSRAAWEAIGSWVLAGGSVVIGTGSDFFRIDNSLVRELLPVVNPVVVLNDSDSPYVNGELRSDAHIHLGPTTDILAITRRYGAGHVTMTPVRLSDLSRAETLLLKELVSPASPVSLDAAGHAAFERLEIVRPSVGAAILLGSISTIVFTALVTVGRRHPRIAVSMVVMASLILSVLSGLYIKKTKPTVAAYASITSLHVSTSVGCSIVSSDFVTMHTESLQLQPPGGLRVRVDYTPDPLRPDYDSLVTADHVLASPLPGHRGWYNAAGPSVRSIDFELDPLQPEKVSVTSWLSKTCPGLLLLDGVAYRLPSVIPGKEDYVLTEGQSLESANAFDPAFAEIYQQFLEDFAQGGKPWVLLFWEESQHAGRDTAAPNTRTLSLYAQQGGSHD